MAVLLGLELLSEDQRGEAAKKKEYKKTRNIGRDKKKKGKEMEKERKGKEEGKGGG